MPRIQKRLGLSIRESEVGVGFSRPSFTNGLSVGAGLEAKITSGIAISLNNGVVVLMAVAIVAVVPVVTVVSVVEVVSVVAVVPIVAVVSLMAIISVVGVVAAFVLD